MMHFTTFQNKKDKKNRCEAGILPASCDYAKIIKSILGIITALAFWFIIWYAFADIIDKDIILPSPVSVIRDLASMMSESSFWISCGTTIIRIIIGTVLGILCGIVIAILMLVSNVVRILLFPLISVIKATPVASFIIAALFWIGRGHVPAFISFLIVLPIISDAVYTGIKNVDVNLEEVTVLFRFSIMKKVRYLYIPSVVPYFLSALRISIGMAWKSGVAAEVLCTPADSIGKALNMTKVYMETSHMFAWTITIIILSVIFERITVNLVGRGLKKYGMMMEGTDVKDK